MKATGMVRRVDDLGRIVIPKDVRKQLNIKEGDALEIFIDKDSVIFQPYHAECKELEEAKTYIEKMLEETPRSHRQSFKPQAFGLVRYFADKYKGEWQEDHILEWWNDEMFHKWDK